MMFYCDGVLKGRNYGHCYESVAGYIHYSGCDRDSDGKLKERSLETIKQIEDRTGMKVPEDWIHSCVVRDIFKRCEGKSEDEVYDAFAQSLINREKYFKAKEKREAEEREINQKIVSGAWDDDVTRDLDSMYIRVDRLDVLEQDFRVFVTIRQAQFEKQKKTLVRCRKEFVQRAMFELESKKKWMNKIGSLDFYYCSEMVLTRDSRVMLMFSVKGSIN